VCARSIRRLAPGAVSRDRRCPTRGPSPEEDLRLYAASARRNAHRPRGRPRRRCTRTSLSRANAKRRCPGGGFRARPFYVALWVHGRLARHDARGGAGAEAPSPFDPASGGRPRRGARNSVFWSERADLRRQRGECPFVHGRSGEAFLHVAGTRYVNGLQPRHGARPDGLSWARAHPARRTPAAAAALAALARPIWRWRKAACSRRSGALRSRWFGPRPAKRRRCCGRDERDPALCPHLAALVPGLPFRSCPRRSSIGTTGRSRRRARHVRVRLARA
jgi:hypothetical protein